MLARDELYDYAGHKNIFNNAIKTSEDRVEEWETINSKRDVHIRNLQLVMDAIFFQVWDDAEEKWIQK